VKPVKIKFLRSVQYLKTTKPHY